MEIQQLIWSEDEGWQTMVEGEPASVVERPIDAHLVLYFASPTILAQQDVFKELSHHYPYAHVVGLATDAQVAGERYYEEKVSAVAIHFKHTQVRLLKGDLSKMQQSYDTGKFLGRQLLAPDLVAVMLVADDLIPDTAALAGTLSQEVGPKVKVFGMSSAAGLGILAAGADARTAGGQVAAVGFYGPHLSVKFARMTGCAPFGGEHVITKADGRELLELDSRPALEIYRKYLKKASPNEEEQRVLFPFFIHHREQPGRGSLRSVLAVNDETGSLILGGAAPEGRFAQLMYASPTEVALEKERRKINQEKLQPARTKGDRLGLMLSTSARRSAFGPLTQKEREVFQETLDADTVITGGYGGGVFVPDEKGDLSRYDNFSAVLMAIQEQ